MASSSSSTLDPLAPGAHYERQYRARAEGVALDVFAVLGLPADNAGLTQHGAKQHFKKRVVHHVFERGEAGPRTSWPLVPLWVYVNVGSIRYGCGRSKTQGYMGDV